jgi:two-component system response regulator AtoC
VFQAEPPPISRATVRLMQKHSWPGNIRQLDNLIRSYVLMGSEEALVAELMEEEKPAESSVMPDVDVSEPISLKLVTKKATRELERRIILKVLKANNWNRQKTAKWLKISYRSLLYKLNEVSENELHRSPTRTKGRSGSGQGTSPGIEPSRLIQ